MTKATHNGKTLIGSLLAVSEVSPLSAWQEHSAGEGADSSMSGPAGRH